MLTADRIDMIVSFLMESGVRLILKDLRDALDRGARVRILTGNYLGITYWNIVLWNITVEGIKK